MLTEILAVTRKELLEVGGPLFAYLFGNINRTQYMRVFDDKVLAKRLLTAAKNSGYIMKNCKLYAYAAWTARESGTSPRPKDYGIHRADLNLLSRLNIRREGCRVLSLSQFDNLVTRCLDDTEINTYIGKFVSKKMAFLIRSYGVTREELEGKLRAEALYALYKHYPHFQSLLHAQNICKTTIHNRGMNIIKFYTADKRQVLRRTAGGFESIQVSMAVLHDSMDMSVADHQDHIDMKLSLQSLQHKMNDRTQRFLNVAAGGYDEEFSTFLGKDNSAAAESMSYERYMGHVQNFFRVTQHATDRLFSKIRVHLQGQADSHKLQPAQVLYAASGMGAQVSRRGSDY